MQDVLILNQFLRKNGTILPRRITGLCTMQQNRVTTLVTMAKRSGSLIYIFISKFILKNILSLSFLTEILHCSSLFFLFNIERKKINYVKNSTEKNKSIINSSLFMRYSRHSNFINLLNTCMFIHMFGTNCFIMQKFLYYL